MLFQERGYAATGLAEIIERSESPKGSFYFHFPGGKEQLAAEALEAAGRQVAAFEQSLIDRAASPAQFIRDYIAAQARVLEESDYRLGCPIATVTLEMATESEAIREAADSVFLSWRTLLADYLVRDGHRPAEAKLLAEHVIATLEGALLLARARRSTVPLRNAAKILAGLVTYDRETTVH
jgi:TetR/AcrR family transcriptional repressor of lmrAB and yxaGH operons